MKWELKDTLFQPTCAMIYSEGEGEKQLPDYPINTKAKTSVTIDQIYLSRNSSNTSYDVSRIMFSSKPMLCGGSKGRCAVLVYIYPPVMIPTEVVFVCTAPEYPSNVQSFE